MDTWQFLVTFSGWLYKWPFQWQSDLQLEDKKVTLNRLVSGDFFSSLLFLVELWGPYEKKHPVFWGPLRTELWNTFLVSPQKKQIVQIYLTFLQEFAAKPYEWIFLPSRKLTYPTWRKGNSSFKSAFKRGYDSSLEGNYWGFVFHNEAVCCRFDFLCQKSHRYNILKAQSHFALQEKMSWRKLMHAALMWKVRGCSKIP